MHAEQRRQPAGLEQRRDRLVGGDHQVLDQPVRLGLLARGLLGHVALARERELRLDRLDRERAARLPRILQRGGGAARGGQRLRPRRARALGTGEDPVHPRVVQALVGADDRAVEGAAAQPRPVELELDRDREPVLVGHERARAVGEHLGQHRLDRAGHVDARGAPERLAVDGGARLHVVRDVGDVHPHPHGAVGEHLGGDRVVEVARGRRVDRERRQRAQVQPAGCLLLGRALGGGARLALDVRLEAPPQPAVEQHRLHDVARHVRAPDPPQDLARARSAGRWARRARGRPPAPPSPRAGARRSCAARA